MSERYECDLCGGCCRAMMVELTPIDLMREPKLQPLARPCHKVVWENGPNGEQKEVGKYPALAMVTDGPDKACRFLGDENRCSIYPTRPGACVALLAGSEQCQKERTKLGLPALLPVPEAATSSP